MTEEAAENLNLGICRPGLPAGSRRHRFPEFTRDQQNARSYLERPENRAAVERILRTLTANLTGYRTLVNGNVPEAPRPARETQPRAAAAHVNPELARQALEDPYIAKVVDVFKGEIVDIKRHVKE